MPLVTPDSLVATVDAVDDAFFFSRPINRADRAAAAAFIAGRLGQPRSYAGLPAPTRDDLIHGAQVFTGEWIRSGAGLAHIFGEEACRALLLLDSPVGKQALASTGAEMIRRLEEAEARGDRRGLYCCGKCSVSLWRHLAAGGLTHAERRLAAGLATLKSRRADTGRWNVFPFHYTLLALSEIDLPAARAELQHAAPAVARALKRAPTGDKYDRRRRALAERILSQA